MMRHAALLAFALLAALPAGARVIRFAKDGSGDYKALDKALEAAQAGDKIAMVGDGFLGISPKKDGSGFAVSQVSKDSPAEKAGLAPGDRIVLVGEQDVSALSLEELVGRLRGPAGGTVVLHIQKGGQGDAKRMEITRGQREYDVTDDYSKAQIAWWSADAKTAVPFAEAAAKSGNAEAAYYLGVAYYNGQGVAKDLKAGARWFRKAAEGGNLLGKSFYGRMLCAGAPAAGVPQDFVAAGPMLQAAVDGLKDPEAARVLGWMHAYGKGVAYDRVEAERLFKLAVDGGSKLAAADLEAWHRAEAQRAQTAAAPAPAAAPSVSREDIRAMVAETLREAKKQEQAKPASAASDADQPTYSKPQRPDDVAVVIGVEKYASLPDASYAEHDADAVRAHLLALGFPERNVFLVKGAAATRSAFVKELESRLRRLVNERSTVFVYYSGHGAPDPKTGEAYLVPYDGDPEFLDDTAYPLKRLYAKLSALPAKRVIVALDSCFSGAGGRSVLAKGMRPLVSKIDLGAAPGGRVAALAAAKGTEISGALDEQAHGAFTYYLLKGLNDGAKTLGDLEAYVKPRVQDDARRHNRDQTPTLVGTGASAVELK